MADDAPPALPPREAATPPELPPRESVEALTLEEEDVADLDAAAAEGYGPRPGLWRRLERATTCRA